MQIRKDSVVSLHLTLTNDEGELLQTSIGGDPINYMHGYGHHVAGLEEALEGAQVGAQIEVTVPPEKGFGWFSMQWVKRVPKSNFPGLERIEVGMTFNAETPQGPRQFVVTAVDGDDVELNGNHPLASQTLHFKVSVESIRKSTPRERKRARAESSSCCDDTACCG